MMKFKRIRNSKSSLYLGKGTPLDFASIKPINSIFSGDMYKYVAQNIMIMLGRNGNTWRILSWMEYKTERTKNNIFSEKEKFYFNKVIRWCFSENNASKFCKEWNIINKKFYKL